MRNDLVYKSGKPSKESLRLAEDMVIEGHLQVTPNDIKEEMEALSSRIDIMVNQGFRDCP